MGILDEAKKMQGAKQHHLRCKVCEWLEGRDDADEWAAVLADTNVHATTIATLAREQYGCPAPTSSWARHRRNGCADAN